MKIDEIIKDNNLKEENLEYSFNNLNITMEETLIITDNIDKATLATQYLNSVIALEDKLLSVDADKEIVTMTLESISNFSDVGLGMTIKSYSEESIEEDTQKILSLSLEEKKSKLGQILEWIKKMFSKAFGKIKDLFGKLLDMLGITDKKAKKLKDDLKSGNLIYDVKRLNKLLSEDFKSICAIANKSLPLKEITNLVDDFVSTGVIAHPDSKDIVRLTQPKHSIFKWYKSSDLKNFDEVPSNLELFPFAFSREKASFITKEKNDTFSIVVLYTKKDFNSEITDLNIDSITDFLTVFTGVVTRVNKLNNLFSDSKTLSKFLENEVKDDEVAEKIKRSSSVYTKTRVGFSMSTAALVRSVITNLEATKKKK